MLFRSVSQSRYRPIIQKVRSHQTSWLPLLVCMRFQDLFHSPHRGSFRLSLTVLVHYRSVTIFSLGGWSPHIQTRFHVPRPTHHHNVCPFVYGTITLYGRTSQSIPLKHTLLNGLFPVRSPLLRESQLISFPKGTEMFHFPSFAS